MSDDRLIVALDVPDRNSALSIVEKLGEHVSFYKIGLGMIASGGLDLAKELKARGKRIFLDMKFFDIGATVEKAVAGIVPLGVDFLTVHGDPAVVRAAVKGRGSSETKILAVTILTALDRGDLNDSLIIAGEMQDLVVERAKRAFLAGADGVIASPNEAAMIRALPEAQGRLIVTPGVRPEGADPGDQKRIATPHKALSEGADHIVVGRPVWNVEDPVEAAKAILKSLP